MVHYVHKHVHRKETGMTFISATLARTQWFAMLKSLKKSHRIYKIASKDGDAVLLSGEDYEGLIETLELLSTPGIAKSIARANKHIKEGKTYSIDEVFGV